MAYKTLAPHKETVQVNLYFLALSRCTLSPKFERVNGRPRYTQVYPRYSITPYFLHNSIIRVGNRICVPPWFLKNLILETTSQLTFKKMSSNMQETILAHKSCTVVMLVQGDTRLQMIVN